MSDRQKENNQESLTQGTSSDTSHSLTSSQSNPQKSDKLVVWQKFRTSVIVYVRPEWRWNLLDVANKLTEAGFHIDTILGERQCLFGSFTSDTDAKAALETAKEIESWVYG